VIKRWDNRTLSLMAIVAVALAACARAQSSQTTTDRVIRYEPGDVDLLLPSGWKEKREDAKLILQPQDASVKLIFFAPAQRGMEAGMAEVNKTVSNRKNTGVDMRGTKVADQMQVQDYYGTGEVEGHQVRWMMTLVDKNTFGEPRLAALTFGDANGFESNLPRVMRILNGLRRIKR